jgi:hypothetical protein
MYTLSEQTPLIEQLNGEVKKLAAELFAKLHPLEAQVTIPSQTDITKSETLKGRLLLILEGMVVCNFDNKKFFFWDEGDVLGTEMLFKSPGYAIWTECAVVCRSYSLNDLFDLVKNNNDAQKSWHQLLGCQIQLLTAVGASLVRGELTTDPAVKMFRTGEKIIEQGTTADNVYSLMSGHAEVFVDGVKVGEVLPDELFGALAALTDTSRTASVVASKDSMVLALPKEHFVELISGRPATVHQLVKDMARTIVALNEKVVGLNGQRT